MKLKQRGTTIIEVLGAVAVGSMMLYGLTAMIDTSLEDVKGQQASLHQARIADAARKYVSANYKTLKDTAYDPSIVIPVSVDDLITQNFLPAGFAQKNAYDQTTCLLVRQPVAGSGKLETLVVTSGGQPIEDRHLGVIASHSGEGGGYIADAAPTTAHGASWSMSTAGYQGVPCAAGGTAVLAGDAGDAGHLVSNLFYDGPGYNDFLYRFAVDGRPDLNKMHTPLRFAEDAIVAEGSACGSHAAIASDSTRNLLRCGADGRWSQLTAWKNPVANFASLPATDKAGDVRMVLDKKRAFVSNGAGSWTALAVDQNGNLYVERDISAGNDVNARYEVNAGRDVIASRDVTARNVTAGNRVSGNTIHSDWWVEATHFEPTQRRWPRDPCMVPYAGGYRWTLGSIVRDVNGVIMSCQYIGGQYVFAYTDGSFYP